MSPEADAPADPAGAAPDRRAAPPPRDELERVRARDPEALGRFFERYFDLVYGVALRLLGMREAAEDLTQEVFFKVQRAADQIDPSRDPAPWLTTIVYNAARDVWRSRTHQLARRSASLDADEPAVPELESRAPGPERAYALKERERLVQEALDRLPEPLRAAIVLHDYQGLGHDEIATLTGIGHAAARTRYSRAHAALAAALDGRIE